MKEPIRDQMAYRHMIALADFFEGWALDARMTPEQYAKLVGWAESLRRLADDVGPGWEPPAPDRLTLMGFPGRKALGERVSGALVGLLLPLTTGWRLPFPVSDAVDRRREKMSLPFC